MENTSAHTNRLINSLSPYLQQHAYNPVDWYEWGEEAFEKARTENKLMLVSIGYSACHWCHVMAHESFEDEETAAIMNRHFVCIKIDREELPDIDQVYMDACQLINGSGGWPLNAITLPDKRPIHALTYLPKGQWQNTILHISDLWKKSPEKAIDYAVKLSEGISNISLPPPANAGNEENNISEIVFNAFVAQYDEVYGGPNRAPKFPMPSNYRFLLQYAELKNNDQAKLMGLFTLKQMSLGGIYDAVAGGFSRYSVDNRWFAPHFEKMLYDNAQLISLYSYAFAVTGNNLFSKVANDTIAFCFEELYSFNDLFYSALDADSEGVEGLYYTYTYSELEQVLGDSAELFCRYYQCTRAGNWEHGRNILFALDTIDKAALQLNSDAETLKSAVKEGLEKLKEFRSGRVMPGLDDKAICSWNGLMLKALAEATIWLGETKYMERLDLHAGSMLKNFNSNNALKRINKGEHVKITAFLEDYATLIDGLICAYQAGFNEAYLLKARLLTEQCINLFYSAEHKFFKFNSDTPLITAKYDISDDVISSGNSIMAHNLWKLSWYFDMNNWREISKNMLQSVYPMLKNSGPWYSNWAALQLIVESGTIQYIISADESERLNLPLKKYYKEANAIFGFAGVETQIPLFKGKEFKGKKLLYTCRDFVCDAPEEIN